MWLFPSASSRSSGIVARICVVYFHTHFLYCFPALFNCSSFHSPCFPSSHASLVFGCLSVMPPQRFVLLLVYVCSHSVFIAIENCLDFLSHLSLLRQPTTFWSLFCLSLVKKKLLSWPPLQPRLYKRYPPVTVLNALRNTTGPPSSSWDHLPE